MSVPQKSLSMDPTKPIIFKAWHFSCCSFVISLFDNNSSKRDVHSCLNLSAPVKLPSPPIATKFDMPRSTKFFAAFKRPGRSLRKLKKKKLTR